MTRLIENTLPAKEKGYYPLLDAVSDPYRYHLERARCITHTYGATMVHYSYNKASQR